ncbi:hypothetical protein B0A54_12050 [Friedmanniomyces endolithicus]|uniref:Uncharacterized protein n=1 Tax=Friedmanniomyces endolithicus TaxID=329885 RepID=A0A4U0UMZ1_9PEZI|nr:hypothetical protein B0A54_12050 [Friedmanniomyces endolithicus]
MKKIGYQFDYVTLVRALRCGKPPPEHPPPRLKPPLSPALEPSPAASKGPETQA